MADAQERQQQQEVTANNAVTQEQQAQLRQQDAQDTESRARENERVRLANQKAASTATVVTGESGASGASVDALLSEYQMQLGQFRDATNRQGQLNRQGLSSQIEASVMGTKFSNLRINAPVAQPNYAAATLDLAGDSMRTLAAYRRYDPSTAAGNGKGRK